MHLRAERSETDWPEASPKGLRGRADQTAFPEQVAELRPDTSAPLVIYGAGAASPDASAAAERLLAHLRSPDFFDTA
jgi:hypothetical protein